MSGTVKVLIENAYECGRESSSRVVVPAPGLSQDLESWWQDEVFDHTGDGHSCGSSEIGSSDARIVEASDRPELVGQTYGWEG
jgi:hypothetical protein